VKIEPWQDLRAAALISCGLSTGFGSAATRGNVRPGDVVAVIGCGGVGSGAIQGALHAGARAVVAIDIEPSKVERALKLGATHGAASTLDAAFTILPELTWGKNCDVVIITVDVLKGELIEQARSITAKGGTVVATAIAPFSQKTVELDLFMFSMFNQQLLGTTFGSVAPRVQIPRLLRLYHEGKLVVDDLITKEYTLDQVQQGYDDVYNGHNVRGVIRF
jgi:S-(hydroxymethyl)glutathione dehydrogenase/alcohol dehydrogenase